MELPLLTQIIAAGLPRPDQEYRFHEGRMYRFDFCWPARMLAVEVDGGTYTRGRHTRGKGYAEDCAKLNAAVLLGWRCLRFTTEQVANGSALATIQKALEQP